MSALVGAVGVSYAELKFGMDVFTAPGFLILRTVNVLTNKQTLLNYDYLYSIAPPSLQS